MLKALRTGFTALRRMWRLPLLERASCTIAAWETHIWI